MSETKHNPGGRSTSKVYFCTKTENFKVCGETNPQNFIEGRYSTCKNCKNKYVRELNKEKKAAKNEEVRNTIDPSTNIRYLIMDCISNYPLLDGKSVEYKIKSCENDIGDVLCTATDNLDKFKKDIYIEIGKMKESFNTIIQGLRETISEMSSELKELKNLRT
jgi:hypothetical protein